MLDLVCQALLVRRFQPFRANDAMHRDRATNDPIAELPLHALHALHGGQITTSSLLVPQQILLHRIGYLNSVAFQ